jgi:hypothetical protein
MRHGVRESPMNQNIIIVLGQGQVKLFFKRINQQLN